MTCKTCWYWSEGPKANASHKENGECRHNSPAPQFPKTHRDDWCGDFTSSGFMPRWMPEWSRVPVSRSGDGK